MITIFAWTNQAVKGSRAVASGNSRRIYPPPRQEEDLMVFRWGIPGLLGAEVAADELLAIVDEWLPAEWAAHALLYQYRQGLRTILARTGLVRYAASGAGPELAAWASGARVVTVGGETIALIASGESASS